MHAKSLPACLLGASLTAACASSGREPVPIDAASAPEPAPSQSAAPRPTDAPTAIADDAPLRAGLVRYEAVVLPTKGGYSLRGVTLDAEKLQRGLEPAPPGGGSFDGPLGAKVRVTAELVERSDPEDAGGLHAQRRAGTYFSLARLVRLELVAAPQLLEGAVARSKGLYSVGDRLVNGHDLEWSLGKPAGDVVGKRVKLWGQPRTVVCDPRAQCLVQGSLPMFDVGRAEQVP